MKKEKRRIELICKICGNVFKVIPFRKNMAKYCSIICRSKSQIGRIYSNETKHKISIAHLGRKHPNQTYPHYYINCKICNKQVRVKPSNLTTQKYCSKECASIGWSKFRKNDNHWRYNPNNIILNNCLQCNKKFKTTKWKKDRGLGKFCSRRCWGIYHRINMKHKETSIERFVKNYLREQKIDFKSQCNISHIAVVDFLIKGKLIIQCDGDYWHSFPNSIKRDKKQNEFFIKNGYVVLRLLESKIKSKPHECKTQIDEYCNKL